MNALEQAIYTAGTAGTALTALLASGSAVYNQSIPSGGAYPCVVFAFSGGGDANLTPLRRKDVLYSIKGISKTSLANAGEIDAQLDALYHNKPLTVPGWTNWWAAREGDIAYTEVTGEGEHIYHNGGIYRFRLCSDS
jgi:hypothetical protein